MRSRTADGVPQTLHSAGMANSERPYGTGNEGGIPWKSLERLEFSENGVRYVDEPQDDNPPYVAEHTREG